MELRVNTMNCKNKYVKRASKISKDGYKNKSTVVKYKQQTMWETHGKYIKAWKKKKKKIKSLDI